MKQEAPRFKNNCRPNWINNPQMTSEELESHLKSILPLIPEDPEPPTEEERQQFRQELSDSRDRVFRQLNAEIDSEQRMQYCRLRRSPWVPRFPRNK